MLRVINAKYGGSDVTKIVENHIKNDVLRVSASNDIFGDPQVGVSKKLEMVLDLDGERFEISANEGENFVFPKQKYSGINTLILTSCNRIEQILFAIAVNKEIIQEDFNLILADCSTPKISVEDGVKMHQSDDPYNLISRSNYNSDWTMVEDYVRGISKIKEFKIIHVEPRMGKQIGEATLITLGLTQASLLGSKHFLKLTGVCHLKYDAFCKFKETSGDQSVITWKRSGFGNQLSSRVFGGRPDRLATALLEAGWCDWLLEYDFIERKFEKVIKKYLNKDFKFPDLDERDIIVDEGIGRHDHRKILTENLEKHGLLNSNDPWIKKFLAGYIWE